MSIRNVARALAETRPTNVKDAVHATLTAAGFDGNGRFRSHSEGIAKLHDALHKHGLTIISHVQAPVGSTPSGHHSLDLGWLHPEGKEDPKPANASVHVQWTNLTHTPGDVGPHGDMPTAKPPRFEFLAYIPHSKLAQPVGEGALKDLGSNHCPDCGRPYVDGMTLNSTGGHSKQHCYKDETGEDPLCAKIAAKRAKPAHERSIVKAINAAVDMVDTVRRDVTGVHSPRQIRRENPHWAAELAKAKKTNEGLFDTPFHSTHYAKVAKHLSDFLDKHAEGHDKEGATPAMRDAQYASFVLKNPQSSGYNTAIGGAHDVIQKHFLDHTTDTGRTAARLTSAARIYVDGAKGKTLDHHIDHMYKLLHGKADGAPANERTIAVHQGDGLHPKMLAKIHKIAAKHGGQHVGWGDGGAHFKFKDGHDEHFRDEVGLATGGSVRTGYVKEAAVDERLPTGGDSDTHLPHTDQQRLAMQRDNYARGNHVAYPDSTHDWKAPNGYIVRTNRDTAGTSLSMSIHTPDGVEVGGVHGGTLFMKRTGMVHRAAAAEAHRAHVAARGDIDADKAVFAGDRSPRWAFRPGQEPTLEYVALIKDPATARVLEWRLLAVDGVSVLVEHPDTHAAYTFSHRVVVG